MTVRFETRAKMSLAGEWQLTFPDDPNGNAQDWVDRSASSAGWGPVAVPGIWNLTYPDRTGVGFYRKNFELPAGWAGETILLRFEGSCYRTEAWLNHRYLGSHEGGYTPFYFDITEAARCGEACELIVRVAALSKTDRVDGMALRHCPASKQTWHYTFGGLWGNVSLECCAPVACETVHVIPNLQQELAEIDITLNNRTASCREASLAVRMTDPKGTEVFSGSEPVWAPPGLSQYHFTVAIPHPLPWSCEDPSLYHLQVSVQQENRELDRAETNFGMRDFTVRDGCFFLNGAPIFLKGVLLQPNYPATLVVPPDPDMIRREVTLAKEAGFNLIRVHIRPAAPGLLDLADQLGMLVYAESSLAWIRESPRMLDRERRELREMIERDRNHPAVVFWGIYNENPPAAALNAEQLAVYVRSLDPTRVVVFNSGGSLAIDQDFGWIERARNLPDRSAAPEPIQDVHLYLGGLISDPVYDWLTHMGTGVSASVLVDAQFGSKAVMEEFDRESRSYAGQIFVSEIGAGGLTDLDDTVARFGDRTHLQDARELEAFRASLWEGFAARGLDQVFGSVRQIYAHAQELQACTDRRQLEAVLCNPRVSGYVLTQLDDVSWECHAGLLDVWRNPKPAYAALQRLNQPHCLVLRTRRPVVKRGEAVQVDLTLVSRERAAGPLELDLTVRDPQGVKLFTSRRGLSGGEGIRYLGEQTLPTGLESGWFQIEGAILCAGEPLARAAQTIRVVDPPEWKDLAAAVSIWGPAPYPLAQTAAENPGQNPSVCLAAQPGALSSSEWTALLDATAAGKTTLLGNLSPTGQPDWRSLEPYGIRPQVHMAIGSWMGCYHWIPDSDLFAGLPVRGLAGETYRTVVPQYSLAEMGGQVLAGALRNTQSLQAPPAMLWYSDIESVPLGRGRLIFCQYRIFDRAAYDLVADRMLNNLVRYACKQAGMDPEPLGKLP